MNEPVIRKAILSDLEKLLLFEQGVIEAEREFDPTLKSTDTYYYDIPAMLQSSDVMLLVAEAENTIVASGYARIEKAKHFVMHELHAYLGFMYVHPEYRGQGINSMIIEGLKEWSLSRNVTELRLEVYFNNVSAIRAYEKLGFSKHMIEMRLGCNEQ